MSAKNELYETLLLRMGQIMLDKGDKFRAKAYNGAAAALHNLTENIYSPAELVKVKGIGKSSIERLTEFESTGKIQMIEEAHVNPMKELMQVYGIGEKVASSLVARGIKTIEQLKDNVHLLNNVQQIGLMYYDDILLRIPRTEIDEYNEIFKVSLDAIDPDARMEVVGSYRRGVLTSGDIDVIMTATSAETWKLWIDALRAANIITHVLSRGDHKCLVIAKIPSSAHYRRVDFLFTNAMEYPFAVLYFTGSKEFNEAMRAYAKTIGYTLNEHEICHLLPNGKKGDVVRSHRMSSERDIFNFLNLQYIDPQFRDGRAIIPLP